jgi:hypothetical protein
MVTKVRKRYGEKQNPTPPNSVSFSKPYGESITLDNVRPKWVGGRFTFDYTEAQWSAIENSLRYLQPDREAIEKARRQAMDLRVAAYDWPPITIRDVRTHLQLVAKNYLLETLRKPDQAARKKWFAHEWTRVDRLSADLARTLNGISRDYQQTAQSR